MHAWQNSNAHLNSSFTELQDSHPRMAVSCYSIQAVVGRSKLLSKGRMPLRPKLRQLQLRGNHPATVKEGLLRATAWCTVGALQSLLQYRTGSSVALRVYSAYLSSTDGTAIHSVCKKVWPFHFHVLYSIALFSHHGILVEWSYIDTLSTTVEARNGHPQKPCM